MLTDEGNAWPRLSLGGQTLTKRQAQIARLVAQGLPNKRIAGRLGVEVGTVKIHLHNIYQKLRISGRVRLVGLSRENRAPVLDRTQQGEALAR